MSLEGSLNVMVVQTETLPPGNGCTAMMGSEQRCKTPGWRLCCPLLARRCSGASRPPRCGSSNNTRRRGRREGRRRTKRCATHDNDLPTDTLPVTERSTFAKPVKKKIRFQQRGTYSSLQEETLALQPGCERHKYETWSGLEIWTKLWTLSSSDRKREMTNPNLPGTWRLG